jgi:cytochrome c biogenesis protein CcmG/thiol:disulfide interchange protein DsbE
MITRRIAPFIALLGLFLVFAVGCFRLGSAPVASFTRTPTSGPAPLAVYFDASASDDPDGTVLTYAWSFGDGSTALGVHATHTYSVEGTYTVELTVTDDDGMQDRFSRAVDVRAEGNLPPEGIDVGSTTRDFTLPDLFTGDPVSLSDFRGYVVLLDFWESTCPPCRTSMPYLEELRQRFGEQGLVVIAVNVDSSEEAARQYVEDEGYEDFVVLRDAGEIIRGLYDVVGIPHTYIIDRQGIIRFEDHPVRIRDRDIEPWL